MTYNKLHHLLIIAGDCEAFDDFLIKSSDSLSDKFSDSLLKDVWQLHENYTYRTIVEISGVSNRQIAQRYNIPIRTAEAWHAYKREIASYLLEFMAADIITQKYAQKI